MVVLTSWGLLVMENKLLETVQKTIKEEKFTVGNDLIFLPDFQKSFTDLFKNKVYTVAEQAYCDSFDEPILRYASTWAAKEAVYKAIKQINPQSLGWKKIEILRDKIAGKPEVKIHQKSSYKISLTISHDGEYVWAVAFIKS